jgi:hypothetical protein
MFTYPVDLEPRKRVIYGTVFDSRQQLDAMKEQKNGYNATSKGSLQYGRNFFVMKKEIKDRTTFTQVDSLDGSLYPTPIKKIQAASLDGIGTPLETNDVIRQGSTYSSYAEVQIHGGVALRDVESIVLSRRALDMSDNVDIQGRIEALAKHHNIPVLTVDDREGSHYQKVLDTTLRGLERAAAKHEAGEF